MTHTGIGVEAAGAAVDGHGRRRPRRALWVMKGLGLGGAEWLTVTSARRFDRARYEIEVAYVLPWKDALVGDLAAADVPVHCVGAAGSRIGWVRRLADLARSGRFDLVHTHSPVPALALRALPRRSRPPVVHTEHNVWQRYRPPTRLANRLTYARNEAVLAVSRGVADSARRPRWTRPRHFPAITVLHHGIDPSTACRGPAARAEGRRRLGLPADATVIGTVANFTPKKDHGTLLDAVSALLTTRPQLRVVLVGSGPLEDALRRRVTGGPLAGAVTFAGSRDDVAQVLPAFDVFVLSSLHEGLPIALLEAMASRVAPVATAVGGVPEVIRDRADGLLVPPADPVALASALAEVLDDAALRERLACAAVRRSEDFGIDRAVREMQDWYDEVLL